MKIRHRIMVWVAGAGLLTSLVFSLVVFWELREQPLKMMDSQLQAAADAVTGQLASVQRPSTVCRKLCYLLLQSVIGSRSMIRTCV